ncbi:MAG: hypothetical protein HQ402_01305 [Parcubacteria group bacterium]|nr:hypothetical protein [Parcubacteria group bacterium]
MIFQPKIKKIEKKQDRFNFCRHRGYGGQAGQALRFNSGQVVILSTVFFLIISIAIVLGLASPILKQAKLSSDLLRSRENLFWAEAGIEDVLYRLKNNMAVSSTEVLILGENKVTTTITTNSEGKNVLAEADRDNYVRKMQTVVTSGTGVPFEYAIHSGLGGFDISGSSGVVGSVYSSGDISSSGTTYVTKSTTVSGSTGQISGTSAGSFRVGLGVTGDAWAHTVKNSTVYGGLYCQTGSGNNKFCDTSKGDPPQKDFPISDADITQWKADALAGGISSGNYSLNNIHASIGPKKITGNLSLSHEAVLTLTGTVWVQGNITLSGPSIIQLDSSYGTSGGIIIADGYIQVDNSARLNGTGQSGSYIMALTTSTCPVGSCSGKGGGKDAISITGAAGSVILVAQNGTISLANSASAQEVVAKKVILSGSSFVYYSSKLLDMSFMSGSSGGFGIGSWKEVE